MRALPAFIAALVALPSLAPASSLTLDQFYTVGTPESLSTSTASYNTNQEIAQTFTASMSGKLGEVDTFIRRFSGTTGNLILDIRDATPSGAPGTTILYSTSVSALSVPTVPNPVAFYDFDLSAANINVVAGKTYAIALHAGPGDVIYQWIGDVGSYVGHDPYSGGGFYERVIGNHDWGTSAGYDLAFKEFVIVPLPSAFAAGALLLTTLASLKLLQPKRRSLA